MSLLRGLWRSWGRPASSMISRWIGDDRVRGSSEPSDGASNAGVRSLSGIIGTGFVTIGFRRSAERLLRYSLGPESPGPYLQLARLYRLGGVDGYEYDEILGLRPAPERHLASAAEVLDLAARRFPADPEVARETALVLLADGRSDAARELLQTGLSNDAEANYLLARTHAHDADRVGGFSSTGFTQHTRLAQRAVLLDPGHASARYHLVRVAIRAGDWTAVRQAFDLDGAAVPAAVAAFADVFDPGSAASDGDEFGRMLATTDRSALLGAPPDWWFAVHWRLISLGRYRHAFDAKHLLADQILDRSPSIVEGGIARFADTVRALAFLQRHDEAVERCVSARRRTIAHRERHVLDELMGDLAFTTGHPPRRWLDPAPTDDLEAEQRFRSLIAGRRIAIVGPAPDPHDTERDLEEADVVIRTKATDGPAIGAADTISYFAATSSQLLGDRIDAALGDDSLTMAVCRPIAWQANPDRRRHPRIRHAPREYSLGLHASPFGLQRIVHDLVHYAPAEISIRGADLFASEQPYAAGYRRDREVEYQRVGLVPNLDGYGHDLLADFRLTAQLAAHGVVRVEASTEAVLAMDPGDYLALLERLHRRSHGRDHMAASPPPSDPAAPDDPAR